MALISAAVMEDSRAVVALVSDDYGVSTLVFASFDGRNILTEWQTSEAIVSVEA